MSGKSGQTVVDRLQAAIHTIDGSEMAKTICKASTHEMMGPKQKHLANLVAMSKAYNINQPELINTIILRTKEKSWVVVLKALITCHHLMIYGSEKVFQVMAARSVVFSLDNFSDPSAVGYDMSSFIRLYSHYLNERSYAYRSLAGDFCKMKKGENSEWKKFDDKKLIDSVNILQTLIDKLVNCSNQNIRNEVIRAAFDLIHRDLIKMFSPYNESMIQIMERLTKMKLTTAKPAFNIYKKFLDHLSNFKIIFDKAATMGMAKNDIPDIKEGPATLLPMFEKHIEDLEAGRITIDSNSNNTSPAKSLSKNTSPTNVSSGNTKTLEQQVLEEEARALDSYKGNDIFPNIWFDPLLTGVLFFDQCFERSGQSLES